MDMKVRNVKCELATSANNFIDGQGTRSEDKRQSFDRSCIEISGSSNPDRGLFLLNRNADRTDTVNGYGRLMAILGVLSFDFTTTLAGI